MIFRMLRKLKYYLVRLFRMKKGAKQIALGIVVGFYPCWFPTFGIGPMLSIVLTKFVRGNVPSAIISASFGSFLWPILFFLNYKLGAVFYNPSSPITTDIEYDETNYIEPIEHVNTLEDVGITFLIGAAVNSILFSVIGYFLFYYLFSRYRESILRRLIRNTNNPNS